MDEATFDTKTAIRKLVNFAAFRMTVAHRIGLLGLLVADARNTKLFRVSSSLRADLRWQLFVLMLGVLDFFCVCLLKSRLEVGGLSWGLLVVAECQTPRITDD